MTYFLLYVQSGGSIYSYKHNSKRALALQPCPCSYPCSAVLFLYILCTAFLQGRRLRSTITLTGEWSDGGELCICRLIRQSSSESSGKLPTMLLNQDQTLNRRIFSGFSVVCSIKPRNPPLDSLCELVGSFAPSMTRAHSSTATIQQLAK